MTTTSCDKWCDKWRVSDLSTACIVRVTNQCDQRCQHCCFRSGPGQMDQLSVETCKKINVWVPEGVVLNIMGGEFSILDNYPEMLVAMSRDRSHIRLVTNGLWARCDTDKFFDAMRSIKAAGCCHIDVAISEDSWHKSDSSYAIELLENFGHVVSLIRAGELYKNDILPLGRAWDNHIVPTECLVCSCESMCSMIITENGMLGKCPHGYLPHKHFSETTWTEAQNYIWRWRSEKLAEGMNCHSCMEKVSQSIVRVGQ